MCRFVLILSASSISFSASHRLLLALSENLFIRDISQCHTLNLDRLAFLSIGHKPIGDLFIYIIGSIGISNYMITFVGVLPEAQMKSLVCMRLYRKDQSSDTFSIGQLSEHNYY